MIPLPALAAFGRPQMIGAAALAIVLLGLVAAVLWYRSEALDAELDLEVMRHRLEVLAAATERQSESIKAAERKAAEAAQRGVKARAEAQAAVNVATQSADALARVMAAPRPIGDCPQAAAVDAVRADLKGHK